jgi:hypothetical protein
LTHNLADRLSLKSINFQKLLSYLKILFWIEWTHIYRVFIRAREAFVVQPKDLDLQQINIDWMEVRYSLYWFPYW